jgi:glutamate N-acetyltransferase/amino-acid N-acetyltransferase
MNEAGKVDGMRSGVTVPEGFKAAGVCCGIKEGETRDLALVYSEQEAGAAATYTTNLFRAAPLQLTEEHLRDGRLQAIVCNSGNANACTGARGLEDARRMAEEVAQALGIRREDVAVASTGVIGHYLPMDKVTGGIREAVAQLSPQGGKGAAEAILTTDTRTKEVSLKGSGYSLGGMAKGSGMIAPRMATMLAFITTDARVETQVLRRCLVEAVDCTFNQITVDGCTSTNDMVVIMANGVSSVEPDEGELGRLLTELCGELAAIIVRDGEGATRFVEVKVTRAASWEEARYAAKAVANSPLVKAAFFGGDPNWGRIMAALGSSGVRLIPEQVSLKINGALLAERGSPHEDVEEFMDVLSLGKEILVEVDLGLGEGEARVWTTDLSEEYVRINAHYRT